MVLRNGLIALLLVVGLGSTAPARAAAAPAAQRADSTLKGMSLDDAEALADTLLARRGGSHAENARLYLTWDAPYGMPRASRTHTPHAHNPAAEDTLWLCFLPGRTSPGFLGYTADLTFRAAPGDTLGPWWHMDGKGVNKGELSIDFGPDSTFVQAQPWAVGGYGGGIINRTPASARVTIVFAVSYTDAVPPRPGWTPRRHSTGRRYSRHSRTSPTACGHWITTARPCRSRDSRRPRAARHSTSRAVRSSSELRATLR